MNAPFPLSAENVSLVQLRDPGEFARLEGFVAEMGGTPFHRPAWLRAVEKSTGQKATGLVAEKCGNVTGWLPLSEVHSPIFGRALVSSGFAVGGGPLASNARTAEYLCRSAEELALRMSCPTIELRGGNAPEAWQHCQDSHAGFVTDLAEDDEQQLLAVPRKQRAEIRKSLKLDLEVSVGRDEADRAAHYAVYAESVRNLGTPVFPRALFDAMLDEFGGDADILTVRHKGVPVASVLSFYHNAAVMPYWGGGTFAARHLRANERMYYELMLHARKRGMARFDFGRSKTESGPYNYKKNWGFEPQPLSYASWTAPGHEKRDINPNSDAYSAKIDLWKRLPLKIANTFGPMIARGLA
ncbi:FemAB family PEP-CTERM system-associated protein [Pontixanthobacter aestiaquae]|uniref:FemAB family PEP-CTERM system-associated protein n=1 Tax=Pontixanthobacter aestiaquae TaxID=1509367 RepID=A0A844Z928_9SPHN|nr:FemAB family XrtA/PEP-CTERM system-associated protein [Pontixanthobacter aestiaquae]MDN3645282.1 FemAB family PEP-CTERM system-associated protein [Pontixanthobacter aestiaquae]MXO83716.1 FemAB family PEP-CTERM system-associated protein [Pontixanthobacter aestiaquae]